MNGVQILKALGVLAASLAAMFVVACKVDADNRQAKPHWGQTENVGIDMGRFENEEVICYIHFHGHSSMQCFQKKTGRSRH